VSRRIEHTLACLLTVAGGACFDPTGPASDVFCELRTEGAVVEIEDPELDLAIHAALGVAASVPLTCGMVQGVATLNASSRGITSMAGLENLTGLTTLNIRDNALTDVGPLRTMTGLTWLNLAFNQIGDVEPLRGLTGLTFLAINGNRAISDIDALSGLTNLTGTLWMGSNAIVSLEPLRELTGLTAVRAWDNRITDASPLAGLDGLTEVNLHTNSLVSADGLDALPALRTANLRNNPALADIQALLGNAALGSGTNVNVASTSVSCSDIDALRARGVAVISDCR